MPPRPRSGFQGAEPLAVSSVQIRQVPFVPESHPSEPRSSTGQGGPSRKKNVMWSIAMWTAGVLLSLVLMAAILLGWI